MRMRFMGVVRRYGHLVTAGLLTLLVSGRGLTNLPLSHDEYYTLYVMNEGLLSQSRDLPLLPYYGLQWLATLGGAWTSDLGLRALPLVAVVVVAVAVAATAFRLGGRVSGYVAGALVALTAAFQQYGQTARPYAVGAALVAVATYLLIRGMTSPERKAWWFAYFAVLLLAGVVVPQALAILVVHGTYVLAVGKAKDIVVPWLLAFGALLIPIVGGLLLLQFGPYGVMHEWLPAPQVDQLARVLTKASDATVVPTGETAAFGFGMVILGLMSRTGRVLVIGVALAAAAIWFVSSLGTSFWLSGSFLPLLTSIPLAAGVTLGGIAWQSTTAVLIALGMIALPAYTSVRLPRSGEADTRLVAQILDENASRSTLVFGSPSDAYSIARAYERYGSGSISLQETRNPASTFWSLYENDRCTVIESWQVGGDIDLRLCLGWEEGSAE